MRSDTRRMSGRVAVSLMFAIFAYLGLLFGGNLVFGPTRGPSFSSASKDSQPPQVSARDVVRGILAADRKIAQKYSTYSSGDAAKAVQPLVGRALEGAVSLSRPAPSALRAIVAKAYYSHGPPPFAA